MRQLMAENTVGLMTVANTTSEKPIAYPLLQATASTQPVAVADALANTAVAWNGALDSVKPVRGHGSAFTDQQDAVHNIVGYYQPYVETTCAYDVINSTTDQGSVFFPISAWDAGSSNITIHTLDGWLFPIPVVEYPLLRKAELLELPGPPTQNRFKWVEVPTLSNQTSLGLVILQPQRGSLVPEKDPVHEYIICTIDAGWGTSSMNISTSRNTNTVVSSLPDLDDVPSSHLSRDLYNGLKAAEAQKQLNTDGAANYYQSSIDSPLPWLGDAFPQKPIKITPEWAEFLNPVIPTVNDTVLNVLFSLVEGVDTGGALDEFDVGEFAQVILSLHVANALARVGYSDVFEGNPKTITLPQTNTNSNWTDVDGTAWVYAKEDFFYLNSEDSNKNWAKFKVKSTIKGYAYNTDGFAPKVAISFLVTYCAIALLHIIYSGVTGKSSSSQSLPTSLLPASAWLTKEFISHTG